MFRGLFSTPHTPHTLAAYAHFQARKLPPLGLAVSILENAAQKFADRALLGEGGASIYTPFAVKLWETELRHSNG